MQEMKVFQVSKQQIKWPKNRYKNEIKTISDTKDDNGCNIYTKHEIDQLLIPQVKVYKCSIQ